MNIKSEFLTESKSLRETVIDRVDVLDKVKKLIMLPGDIYSSIEMTANFYEVPMETIKSLIHDHRKELEATGLKVLTGTELNSLKELSLISKNARHYTAIPRKTILCIGMLLQESEVAKSVRSYLLDVEEEKQPEIKTVSTVEDLIIMQAQSVKELKIEVAELRANQEKDRALIAEIASASVQAEKVENEVTIIKETLLQRDNDWRKAINGMLNAAAFRIGGKYADLRNESYGRLEERAHCNLKSRLTRLHGRLEAAGATKSKIENTTRMDVIEADDKLKEIYSAIVKEISIGSLKLVGG